MSHHGYLMVSSLENPFSYILSLFATCRLERLMCVHALSVSKCGSGFLVYL